MNDDKFRVRSLTSSVCDVVSTQPDITVKEATSRMLLSDYSQLPVMTTERTVKGIFSWKSLGSALRLGADPHYVRDCMDSNVTVVQLDDNVIGAVEKIIESDYVLVKEGAGKVCGICTLHDIGELFLAHSRPFIEIEQIELSIRHLIGDLLSESDFADLQELTGSPTKISSASDLTFGAYIKWLENSDNWNRLRLDMDRKSFIDQLKLLNRIRNELMHFRTEGIKAKDLQVLKTSSRFFRLIRKVGSS